MYLAYLLASVLFIWGLKDLGSPKTARRGNAVGAVGMLIAVVVTLLHKEIVSYYWIIAGIVVGSFLGILMAKMVKMTQMPQMVGILNGFGGLASAFIAMSDYLVKKPETASVDWIITVVLSIVVGMVTLTGSVVASAKLHGTMKSAPILYRFQLQSNSLLLLVTLAIGAVAVVSPFGTWVVGGYTLTSLHILLVVFALSCLLGILIVIPIGGADMPVVISLLNSYSGIAAAMTGFVLDNSVLIIAGALVGASGIFLTKTMCDAMNRSLANVMFAGVGAEVTGATAAQPQKTVVRYTPDDVVMRLETAQTVIIVPGYGLAVAQAQHALHQMASILIERGLQVRYAIHPVAGRMPGHMNVLLAEANVPYELLLGLDEINEDFSNTDVVMVVGANDVVNPAARYKKESPLYGMPIFNSDYARTIMVLKRSLNPGFAGEDNELFFNDKTMMVFGDAKKSLTEIVNLLKKK
jgi:NAD(P) transhydrogenase subunit beta